MKKMLIAFIMFAINTTINAQHKDSCNYELSGVILDIDTNKPLPFVTVNVKGTERFLLTDVNGAFNIEELCDQSSTLIISCLGYCDTTCQHYQEHSKNAFVYLKKEVNLLEAVTVTGKRSKEEGTVSIAQQSINKEVLSANPTQSLAAAISAIEGVSFTSNGSNVQIPIIHGVSGNRLLLLNNGVKHGFQNWGTDHAPEIDVSTANSVTVVKGAAGVRYGPEALGGAIIVKSDPLYLNKSFKSTIGTGFQTNGRGYFTNAEIAQGFKKWSYHLGGNYTRIGDRNAPDYSLTNSGKIEKSINGGLRYQLNNLDFKAYYSYLDQNLALLRSSIAESGNAFVRAVNSAEPVIIRPFSYEINEPNQVVQHHLGKLEIDWSYSDDAKLTFRFGGQLNKRKEFDVRRNADLPIIDLDLITTDYQLEWKHPDWFNLDGLIGLQLFTQNNDNNPGTGTTAFIPNYNTFRNSIFIIESLKKDKGTFEFGIRLDYEYNNVRGRETNQDIFTDDYSSTNLTSSLGYIHQLSGNNTFRTNLATAWRTPNVAELFSFGQNGFKTSFGLLRFFTNEDGEFRTDRVIGFRDSDVAPEKGYKWINEWKIHKKNNIFVIAGYANYIENFIFSRPLAVIGTIRGPMPVFIFDQANALFIGVDASWQKEWSNSINGTFGLSYLWSRNIKENQPLIDQPPITLTYQLGWEIPRFWKTKSSQLSFKPSYTFRQFQAPRTVSPEELIDGSVVITSESEIFDFQDAPNGYFLFDIAWRLKFKRFDAGLSVQNVFNTRYRNDLNELRLFADEPGINFLFKINYFFNSEAVLK